MPKLLTKRECEMFHFMVHMERQIMDVDYCSGIIAVPLTDFEITVRTAKRLSFELNNNDIAKECKNLSETDEHLISSKL